MNIRIHDIIPVTTANGPGKRFGIWVQGCDRRCPDCFNQGTHPLDSGTLVPVADIVWEILAEPGIEGISVSGGEPFLQAAPLRSLIESIKQQSDLSVLVYTGFTRAELEADNQHAPLLQMVDILIAGPYIKEQKLEQPLLSSANQKIHFLTDRYSILNLDCPDCEYIIHEDGTIIITGSNI